MDILIAFAIVILCAFVLFSGSVYWFFKAKQYLRERNELTKQLDALLSIIPNVTNFPNGEYYWVSLAWGDERPITISGVSFARLAKLGTNQAFPSIVGAFSTDDLPLVATPHPFIVDNGVIISG